eukprot:1687390-Rhodomonas_salina.1
MIYYRMIAIQFTGMDSDWNNGSCVNSYQSRSGITTPRQLWSDLGQGWRIQANVSSDEMLSLLTALEFSFPGTARYSIINALTDHGPRRAVPAASMNHTPSPPGTVSRSSTVDLTSPNKTVPDTQPDSGSFLLDLADSLQDSPLWLASECTVDLPDVPQGRWWICEQSYLNPELPAQYIFKGRAYELGGGRDYAITSDILSDAPKFDCGIRGQLGSGGGPGSARC